MSQSIHLQRTLVLHLIPTERTTFFGQFDFEWHFFLFFAGKDDAEDKDKEKANENGEEVDGSKKDEKSGDEKDEEKSEEEQEEVKEKKKVTAPPKKPLPKFKGKGMLLADIALVDVNITNTKADSLSVLHNMIYEDPGNIKFIKKNLRRFNGFDFDDKSEEYTRRLEAAKKVDLSKLALTADVLDLSDKGTVDELSERVLTFLLKPDGTKTGVVEDNSEQSENEEDEQEDEEEEEEKTTKPAKKAANKRPEPKKSARGRPQRATAGRKSTKDNFSYIDYESEEEEEEVAVPARKRGKNASDSGSDYNPSGGSDSEAGKKKGSRTSARAGKRSRYEESESEEESEDISEEDYSEVSSLLIFNPYSVTNWNPFTGGTT